MKTWLFAALETVIALLGLAAYFFADSAILTASAVVAATGLGVFQSLQAAHQKNRLDAFQEEQFQKSVGAVDDQLQTLLDESIAPPLPHRPTISSILHHRFGEEAEFLLLEFDRLIEVINEDSSIAKTFASEFAQKIPDWSVGPYLSGLVCLNGGDPKAAREHFLVASEMQPEWIAPWLGWATAAAQEGRWDEICKNHPHINGVELIPYNAGNEQSFLDLSEEERATLTDGFQHAARSLGNFYTIAELNRSKSLMHDTRAEFLKAA